MQRNLGCSGYTVLCICVFLLVSPRVALSSWSAFNIAFVYTKKHGSCSRTPVGSAWYIYSGLSWVTAICRMPPAEFLREENPCSAKPMPSLLLPLTWFLLMRDLSASAAQPSTSGFKLSEEVLGSWAANVGCSLSHLRQEVWTSLLQTCVRFSTVLNFCCWRPLQRGMNCAACKWCPCSYCDE